ncbi:NAD+ synthase [Pelomyxa schiedti]|nr:NAD+ synthase [Pelomyxa schiedti]
MQTYQRAPLPGVLHEKLSQFRTKRNFNVAEWIDKKAEMLNDYMRKSRLQACVVNMSGGIDSSVTLALAKVASQKSDTPIKRLLGVAQPIHSTSTIQNRAYECCTGLGVECVTVDQTAVHDQLCLQIDTAMGMGFNKFARGQMRSYQRTPVVYYIAQLLSCNGMPCIVIGTGNFDEDGYLRYFCKAGDGIADIQLIADLHKNEVFAVANHLHVPNSILVAPPSADLWEGQTDEGELGFTYDFVELFTEFLMLPEEEQRAFEASLPPPELEYWTRNSNKARHEHAKNAHKAEYPINLNLMKTFEDLARH